jgi:formamidopyrimidine-DNA glycosylase
MPELPEVETIARGLAPRLVRARIETVEHLRADYVRGPAPGPRRLLTGRTITAVRRHGKRLLLDLDPTGIVVVHLGMSGQVGVVAGNTAVESHTHLRLRLTRSGARRGSPDELRVRDPRRFGGVWVSDSVEMPRLRGARARNGAGLGPLGPDALDVPWETFLPRLRTRRQLKAILLDQATLAGLGNIYVDEALWAARLHPRRIAASVPVARLRELHDAVGRILHAAIDGRGSTLRDYRTATGDAGTFQGSHRVYGRTGERCPRDCGGIIRREVVAGRSSHFCPRCQRAPHPRR